MIQKIIQPIIDVLKYHKMKLFVGLLSFLFFTVIMFPFNDLSGLVTQKVAELTQNQVFVKFDRLQLGLIPQLGLKLTGVEVQAPNLPTLAAGALTVSPSLTGLLTFKPGVAITAEEFMGGNVFLSTRGGESTEEGVMLQNVLLQGDELSAKELVSMLLSASGISGQLSFNIQGVVDPSFKEQPDMDVDVSGRNINIAGISIPTPAGPLELPNTLLKTLVAQGRLKNGTLQIQNAQLGSPDDELYVQIKGRVGLQIRAIRKNINFIPRDYNLDIWIKTKDSFQNKASLYLSFIDAYKKSTPGGAEYLFRVAASSVRMPPNMQALPSFN